MATMWCLCGNTRLVDFPLGERVESQEISIRRRDEALQRIRDGGWHLADAGKTLRFGFAKSKKQLQRNFCVKKACDMIGRDPTARDKTVEANWKHAVKGKRAVEVNGETAFLHESSDMQGRFVAPFSHLNFG